MPYKGKTQYCRLDSKLCRHNFLKHFMTIVFECVLPIQIYMYMNIGLTDIFFSGRCHFKNIFSFDKRPFVLHLIHFKWPPFHQISCALKKRRRKTTEVLFRLKYQVFNRTLFLQLLFHRNSSNHSILTKVSTIQKIQVFVHQKTTNHSFLSFTFTYKRPYKEILYST